jgi:hypothetical protein
MRHLFAFLIFMIAAGTIASCDRKPQKLDKTADIKVFKENAIEYLAHTKKLPDGRFVIQLDRNIFHDHAQIGHTVLADTLPDLGKEDVTTEEEDDEGDVTQTKAHVDKQYDILFKVDSLRE